MKNEEQRLRYRILNGEGKRGEPIEKSWRHEPVVDVQVPERPFGARGALIVGATALAGVGLGLIAVIAGVAAIGLAGEAILAPAIALKVAGGLAGGGVGMAKGLDNARASGRLDGGSLGR